MEVAVVHCDTGLAQPVTEMSTISLPGVRTQLAHEVDYFPTIYV
jgi:hypothetical protein